MRIKLAVLIERRAQRIYSTAKGRRDERDTSDRYVIKTDEAARA